MSDSKPIIGITMGDPAGIGSEVIVKAYPEISQEANIVVIGDASVLEDALDICESELRLEVVEDVKESHFDEGAICVLDLDQITGPQYGVIDEEYGEASLAYIRRAIELAVEGEIDAITTAPINKQATELAGSEYAGHTGMLADYTNTESYSMLLIEEPLRVSHVSTHVPLEEAIEQVTTNNVYETIAVTHDALVDLGLTDPKIAVAGLNPHASDGGLLGTRDLEEIKPAVERARQEGWNVIGPESPDTVYIQAAQGAYDCVVSMYHDEGHIPIKMLGFQGDGAVSGVNTTIGLPIVRTSVDHGTAFDIAGEGIADEQSMIDAVRVAVEMS